MRFLTIIIFSGMILSVVNQSGFGRTIDEIMSGHSEDKVKLLESTQLTLEGRLAYEKGEYSDALQSFENALILNYELGVKKAIVSNLYEIGNVYKMLGKYDKALNYYMQSFRLAFDVNTFKIAEDVDFKTIPVIANYIGAIYKEIGIYNEALRYLDVSLKMFEMMHEQKGMAETLNNIGQIYCECEEYEKALKNYNKCLEISASLKIPQHVATCLNNISNVKYKLGKFDESLANLRQSLRIYEELGYQHGIATGLNNIGAIYQELEDYDKAVECLNKAVRIRRDLGKSREVATSLSNLCSIYLNLKNFEKAEAIVKEIEEINKENDEWYKQTGLIHFSEGLVEVYIGTGRERDALRYLDQVDMKWFQSDITRIRYFTHYGLSFSGIGEYKKASLELLKAIELIEGVRARSGAGNVSFFGSGIYGGRIRPHKALVAALSERVLKGEGHDDAFEGYGKGLHSAAFYFSESTKARTLIEGIVNSSVRYESPGIPEDLRMQEQDLQSQLARLNETKEDTYKKGKDAFGEHQERYKKVRMELESLIARFKKEYPRYAALKYPSPFKVDELPLKENEVLLEYELTEKAGYVFVAERHADSSVRVKKIVKISKTREEIEGYVNDYVLSMQNPYKKEAFSPVASRKLYTLLLEDALKGISVEKHLIIVPDGILGLLPFESLATEAGQDYRDSIYAGDKWKITYSPSATVLALNRMLRPSRAKKPLFALGDPVYNKDDERYVAYKQGIQPPALLARGGKHTVFRALATRKEWGKTRIDDPEGQEIQFDPLPETGDEVTRIAEFFGVRPSPPDVLLGVSASETNLRKVPLKDYCYVHFATHADLPGSVQGINEPFILLGQVENKDKDDGFLTLTEVLGMDLDADMVVLSACLTGRGNVMEGEGVMNFARAFQHAGARSVVVSLWEVASKEAVEFMEIFYRHLKGGKNRAEALKLARKEIKSKYPHPFYWSVFVIYGEG